MTLPELLKTTVEMGGSDLHLTTNSAPLVRVDGTLIGHTAAQYIMQRADGLVVAEPVCDVGFSIVERATT